MSFNCDGVMTCVNNWLSTSFILLKLTQHKTSARVTSCCRTYWALDLSLSSWPISYYCLNTFRGSCSSSRPRKPHPVMLFRAALYAHATSSNMTNPAEQAKADLAGYHSTLSFIQSGSLCTLVHCAVCVVLCRYISYQISVTTCLKSKQFGGHYIPWGLGCM